MGSKRWAALAELQGLRSLHKSLSEFIFSVFNFSLSCYVIFILRHYTEMNGGGGHLLRIPRRRGLRVRASCVLRKVYGIDHHSNEDMTAGFAPIVLAVSGAALS